MNLPSWVMNPREVKLVVFESRDTSVSSRVIVPISVKTFHSSQAHVHGFGMMGCLSADWNNHNINLLREIQWVTGCIQTRRIPQTINASISHPLASWAWQQIPEWSWHPSLWRHHPPAEQFHLRIHCQAAYQRRCRQGIRPILSNLLLPCKRFWFVCYLQQLTHLDMHQIKERLNGLGRR